MTFQALRDQVVLITGAAGGIGAATAERLAAAGARPVLADLDAAALADVARRVGGDPLTVVLDVTDPAACEAAVAATLARHGRLDVVWANAGVSAYGPLDLVDGDVWRRVVEVNLIGAYNIVRAALPAVIDQQGHVAFTCSWASFAHSPGHSAYAAAKAGLEALADSLRSEVAPLGVTVGAVHPGWIATPMVTEKQAHQAAFRALMSSLPAPLRALTSVDDMADVLVSALARRAQRVIHPRTGWALYALRPLLPLAPFTAAGRKVAPEIRRLFAEQAAEEGAAATAMSQRYRVLSG
jgi:NAD(P)-dependent dehydrogenase (short-subunit alcohol dehydrogenase family)